MLYSNIHDLSGVAVQPQFIPQSFFEKKEGATHLFDGNTVKLKLLVNGLQKNPGKNIIISDADIIVNRPDLLYDYLQQYVSKDIVFMEEDTPKGSSVNIGFGLVKSSEKTIQFFTQMIQHIEKEGGHDQTLYNEWIAANKFDGTTDVFSIPEFLQSNNYKKHMIDIENTKPNILVQLLNSQSDFTLNTIEKLLSAILFVDITDILSLLPEETFDLLKEYIRAMYPGHYLLDVPYPKKDEDGQ